MIYRIEYSDKFQKTIDKFDKSVQKQIKNTIDRHITNLEACDVKKLKGYESLYRLRSGDYRIIYEKIDNILVIVFFDVKHRKDVYRDL